MLEFLSANQAYYKLSKMVQYIEIGPVVPEIFDFLFKSVAVSRTLPRVPRIAKPLIGVSRRETRLGDISRIARQNISILAIFIQI